MRIVIIGGGVSGLAAAHHLHRIAPEIDLLLLEDGPRLGGKIATEHVDGFVIEGGPDSFLASKPRGVGLVEELGMEGRLQGTRPETRGSYVLRGGRLHPMPEGLTGLVPSRLQPLLESDLFSPQGKSRLQQEESISPATRPGDETLAAFVERRFGREVYERLVEPLMAGIYAGDGERLSLQATFPQLRRLELEHGSVVGGLQATQPAGSRPGARTGFVTPIEGMAQIVDALAAELDAIAATGRAVQTVCARAGGYELELEGGESVGADSVIMATPAYVAAQLAREVAPAAAAALSQVPYVSSATVVLGFRNDDLSDIPTGHGYVIPRAERRPALACTFVSQKWANRAPSDASLFRVFIGRAGEPDPLMLSNDSLIEIARAELRDTLGITAEPILQTVARHPRAMPQYTLGHLDRLETIDADLAVHDGLFFAGALRGVGIPDCIASGETAAARAAEFVRGRASSHR